MCHTRVPPPRAQGAMPQERVASAGGPDFAVSGIVPESIPPLTIPSAVLPTLAGPRSELAHRNVDAFGDPREESIDWRRYVAALSRYRWWILLLVVLGGAAGVMATRLMPTRYMATTTIWIQTSEPRPSANAIRGPIGTDQLLPSEGAIPLLRSYVVLDDVVRQRRLYVHPDPRSRAVVESLAVQDKYQPGLYQLDVDRTGKTYRLSTGQGGSSITLEQGAVGDSIGRKLGMLWAPSATKLPAGGKFTFALAPLRDAAQGLSSDLSAAVDQSGNFLRVVLLGPDPVGVAATVNAIADRYVAIATDLKRAKLGELTRLLDDQLAASKENLRKSEDALAAFRARTITMTPDPGSSTTIGAPSSIGAGSDYFRMRMEADQLRRDRESMARVLASSGDSGSIDGLAYIGAVQRSANLTQALQELTTKRAELRALRYRYTDDHPQVRRLKDDIALLERRTIPALAQTVMGELQGREQALTPQIAEGGRDLQAVPQRAVEEARLKRDADIAAALYTAVQSRQSEARLAEASTIADVRVLDAAVPPRGPVKAADSRLIILGVLAGLGLGLLGAVIADRFDPRVRYADQVTNEMGLRILGMLPHVRNHEAGPDDSQVAQLIEAMRSVRLSLIHAHGPARPVIVTVTSPGMGDGKSFVSTNLALASAQAGQRTLLIDGDARRGKLHRGIQRLRTPGLTDFLSGAVPFDAIMQTTDYPFLHFIGAGRRTRESPELLGSPIMGEFLARVRDGFDMIVMDSPPLGAGVDSSTLATLTGAMVLVLRTGTTHRDVTRAHLAMVSHLPIRLLGVVLNDVRPGGMYGMYNYYYLPGYGTVDEQMEDAAARRKSDATGLQVAVHSEVSSLPASHALRPET